LFKEKEENQHLKLKQIIMCTEETGKLIAKKEEY
jgi:hypothetical protein